MSSEKKSESPNEDTISELTALTSELDLSNAVTTEATVESGSIQPKSEKSIEELLLESYECLENKRHGRLDRNVLSSWTIFGERKIGFDETTKFADKEIVQKLYSAYLEYELFSESERRTKKQRVNPLEEVKKAFLLNRAAVKFANIDSLLGYMFSNPVDKLGRSIIEPNELMYFVDIWGGPGGFADYLLWRRDWQTKGFGIPMKNGFYGTNRFTVGGERFTIFKGAKRDGDITNEENITSIVRYVKQHISLGVHIAVADGAYDVENQKYGKETIFKRMYLSEAILALSLLRQNGHFIMKLFDVLMPFTVGLIYLLHKCFAQVILLKPKSSRPSSAERYLICKWKFHDTTNIRMYLEEVNVKLNNTEDLDVISLVPEEILLNDIEFFNFVYKSNNSLAEIQTESMLQMTRGGSACSSDPSLVQTCLEYWNVVPKTDVIFDCTIGEWAKFVNFPENLLSPLLPLCESFGLPGGKLGNEWHCIRIENVSTDRRTFFSTNSSTDVKMWDPISTEWINAPPNFGLKFPTNTFLYGEIACNHVQNANSNGKSSDGFHIIDGLVLNGQDIRGHPYLVRLELCKKFADAINNSSSFIRIENGESIRTASINCKETFLLKDLVPEMEKFRGSWKSIQSGSKVLGHSLQTFIGPKRFHAVNGLLFLRNFPNVRDETNFNETFRSRQLWNWSRSDTLDTVDIAKTPDDGNVYLSHFCEYMNRQVNCGALNWRDKNRPQNPSRYSNNRGRSGARGRTGFKK
ncbi:cap-specific mRNA (nucleoside-2'-O-)-methyltransferase 1-like [Bradysia coprophila]|uniref:cap-specific mRNA (nucleoside-2'-O-)-methyltransferase 1-like n=1 Tax=Bradysia coprophila TaxID=38358 RepID=UPI00187D7773|nr:cap-specific mRNA (nucleoside-2'-O-)-methyltransferase 1-like [Bradysia coprophila]